MEGFLEVMEVLFGGDGGCGGGVVGVEVMGVLLEVMEVRAAPDLHCGESPGSEVVLGAPGLEILLIV